MKTFYKFFPLIDHLYIYQLLEYQPRDFLKWFFRFPFKRNLQRKHSIDWTLKIRLMLILTLGLIFITAFTFAFDFLLYILFLLFLFQLSPFFILIAQIILHPFEEYKKQQILDQAKNKIVALPNLKVVAIVGSFAKTSIKNMLYTLLWKDFRVVKTPKSYNTDLAIARTVLTSLKTSTEVFLVEMDAYHPGEIKKLASIVKPNLAIITSIAPQHLERFGSMEKLARTQFEIADSLYFRHHQSKKEERILFLNSSSKWILDLEKNYQVKKIFYGDRYSDDGYIQNIITTEEGIEFKMVLDEKLIHIKLPVPGAHQAFNFLAAATIARKLGLDLKTIQKRAALILPTEHRLEVRNMGHLKIIDNTYNTNPIAANSSLKLLADLKASQKILITPGFIELGEDSFEENKQLIIEAAKIATDIIIVGETNKKALFEGIIASGFSTKKTHYFKTTQEVLSLLSKIAQKEAVVLLENDLPDQYC